eukprot:jgi/Mesen1/5035/ME000025S04437
MARQGKTSQRLLGLGLLTAGLSLYAQSAQVWQRQQRQQRKRLGRALEHKTEEDQESSAVALRYIHAGLELSEREAARLRRDEQQRVVMQQQKLYLVLDLDHTLLNSARFCEVSHEDAAYLESTYLRQDLPAGTAGDGPGDCGGSAPPLPLLHKLPRLAMWTKLRPGIRAFLEGASRMFEMLVYTNGERAYAHAMARLLDPEGVYFRDRIISHGDSTRRGTKDLDVVLGTESAVVILDDTEEVWPRHRANLILVERYHFFRSSRRQFGLQGPALVEAHRDESAAEGCLASLLPALTSIHSTFFHSKGSLNSSSARADASGSTLPDVRHVLSSVRRRILQDCHIVFSRVYPVDIPNPQLHPLWRMAEGMGAVCHHSITPEITHVVAHDNTTDKAQWSSKHGRQLVQPGWLEASLFLWKRAKEGDFPVGRGQGHGLGLGQKEAQEAPCEIASKTVETTEH